MRGPGKSNRPPARGGGCSDGELERTHAEDSRSRSDRQAPQQQPQDDDARERSVFEMSADEQDAVSRVERGVSETRKPGTGGDQHGPRR